MRSMDYTEVTCAKGQEMKQFIGNSMLLDPLTQEKEQMTLESL